MKPFPLYDASAFQGKSRTRNYFEGWYVRCVDDSGWSFALIPGMSIDRSGSKTAFLQLIESSGSSHYFNYPFDQFQASTDDFNVRIGPNQFNRDFIKIDLREKGLSFQAELKLANAPKFGEQYHPLNVMGWLSKVPLLPCYHHIIQMSTSVAGKISWKNEHRLLRNGKVYIEKDWGSSFPKKWNWLQSLSFEKNVGSLSAVTSWVPVLGFPIPAGMAALELNGEYFFWSSAWGHTWKSQWADGILKLAFNNPQHKLNLSIESHGQAPLIAPVHGEMKRTIQESLVGKIDLELKGSNGTLILSDTALQSGVEIVR